MAFRRLVSIIVLVFTVATLVGVLVQGRDELSQIENWTNCLFALGQGFLLYPLSLAIQSLNWSKMMARLAQVAGGWHDIEIYAYTHLMRRIPGGIWYLTGRMTAYDELGVKNSTTLAASGLEWLLLLFAAALVWGTMKLSVFTDWRLSIMIGSVVASACVGIAHQVLSKRNRSRLPRFIRELLDQYGANSSLPRVGELGWWIGNYVVAYVIGGLILFVLVRSVAPKSSVSLSGAVSIWALTGGIGSLTSTVLPAAFGIRELTLTALLTPTVATARAVLIAFLFRALFIAGDLVWGGALWGLARALGQESLH